MSIGIAGRLVRGFCVGLEYFNASAFSYFTIVIALGFVRISVFFVPDANFTEQEEEE